jgi:hypothetical protein
MPGEIVDHDVDLELGVHVRSERLQERHEVLGPMLRLAACDHRPGGDVQRGEEIERPVAQIGVGAGLRRAEIHRQNRLRAFDTPTRTITYRKGFE